MSYSPSRRTLVKGAAWSVPVVAVGSAAPAVAATGECIDFYFGEGSSRCTEGGPGADYVLNFCIDNNCSEGEASTVCIRLDMGLFNNSGCQLTITSGNDGQICSEVAGGSSSCTGIMVEATTRDTGCSAANDIWFYYTVDGGDPIYTSVPAPINCLNGDAVTEEAPAEEAPAEETVTEEAPAEETTEEAPVDTEQATAAPEGDN